ncbi:YibE/F family protein [Latilactobacillus fuchuensis]|uniref:YibE/F family protein n=2 Tax=Latilactobacillus fuchuensis TaxID=164393 RepID=A0A2N9DXE5_9LACO|nr:YibE/F family protein [Latilactobacillus fuchuensis]KRL59695.1 hypothetical protein FC69_GL001517 [Latilactobacillus fuchuensis DSM 14340 = JCM 11249]SPC39341.1 conserved membrane hypothetical protein [Latilactobacillus fuchuensis]
MTTKKRLWIGLIGLLICILGLLGTRNDASLYQQPIIQITQVKTTDKTKSIDDYQNQDTDVTQQVTGTFLNTTAKGRSIQLQNRYTVSQASSFRYYRGQQVYLHQDTTSHRYTLSEPKRDTVVVGVVLGTLTLLLVVMFNRGLKTILSIGLNLLLFIVAIRLDVALGGRWLLPLMGSLAILLTALTLVLILGPNRQFLVSFLATISATFLALLISVVILKITNDQGIHYETMAYELQPYKTVFLAEVLLGILGAVMDETTDISSSLQQLVLEQPTVTPNQLFKSGLAIGREIIGPLVNVLFFIVMAEAFPIMLLYLRNGNTIAYTLSRTMTIGFTQTVISAIGITLAVPVTSFLASRLVGVKTA